MRTEPEVVNLCLALIGRPVNLSPAHSALVNTTPTATTADRAVDAIRRELRHCAAPPATHSGHSVARGASPQRARPTPLLIAKSMMPRLARQPQPARVADHGASSRRFLPAATPPHRRMLMRVGAGERLPGGILLSSSTCTVSVHAS